MFPLSRRLSPLQTPRRGGEAATPLGTVHYPRAVGSGEAAGRSRNSVLGRGGRPGEAAREGLGGPAGVQWVENVFWPRAWLEHRPGGGRAGGPGEGPNQPVESCLPCPPPPPRALCPGSLRHPEGLRGALWSLGVAVLVPRAASRRWHQATSARDEIPLHPAHLLPWPSPPRLIPPPCSALLALPLVLQRPGGSRHRQDETLELGSGWHPRGRARRAHPLGVPT